MGLGEWILVVTNVLMIALAVAQKLNAVKLVAALKVMIGCIEFARPTKKLVDQLGPAAAAVEAIKMAIEERGRAAGVEEKVVAPLKARVVDGAQVVGDGAAK